MYVCTTSRGAICSSETYLIKLSQGQKCGYCICVSIAGTAGMRIKDLIRILPPFNSAEQAIVCANNEICVSSYVNCIDSAGESFG